MAVDVKRAWKDPEYRKTLTSDELGSVPPNPAGPSELSDEDLGNVSGVGTSAPVTQCGICGPYLPPPPPNVQPTAACVLK